MHLHDLDVEAVAQRARMIDDFREQFADARQRAQGRQLLIVELRRDARMHHQRAQCALFAVRHAAPLAARRRLARRCRDPRIDVGQPRNLFERNVEAVGEHVHDLRAQRVRGERLQ